MGAKNTIFRLFSADHSLMDHFGPLILELFIPVEPFTEMLKNCSEGKKQEKKPFYHFLFLGARLRECLIDESFQQILLEIFNRKMNGALVGRFLSDTSLSIKELICMSPDGVALSKLYEECEKVDFICFLVNSGVKISDVGSLIRNSKKHVLQSVEKMNEDEKTHLRKLLKKGTLRKYDTYLS